MLTANPTSKLGGLVLWGDYDDLSAHYDLVHQVCGQDGPLPYDVGEFVLGLAYDLRKAKEGQRLTREVQRLGGDSKRLYGVEIVWTFLLPQVAILRGAAAFMVLTSRDQAMMWELEAAVEEAAEEGFGTDIGRAVIDRMRRLRSGPWPDLIEKSKTRSAYFLDRSGKAARKSSIVPVMDSMNPMYEANASLGMNKVAIAEGRMIDPKDFKTYTEIHEEVCAGAKL
ncbi:DUF6904 family protein [Nitrospirillum amazonense]|uniref:DUF6904 family protein n=1 Tax=Nitrospirillum amazonense TaxID=28077 RepID=UPI002412203B|nr:hypothetical protein [Nitrospirillum amazonense]MDG3444621.1 hypothetical protein [Nitrospirillum amazonense]